jgi:small nuclear ribonucleoprotein (snRNP)-like protein
MHGMDRPPKRKRKGRSGSQSGHRQPPGRRTPPPTRTGLEAKFFSDAIRSGARLVLMLADGRKVRGTVREFDRDQVTIEEATGSVVIRKSDIRYLYEQG